MRACYNYGTAGYISGISVQVNTNGILPGYCNKDIVENITYNEFGQTSSLTLGNGITTSYGYDVKGRMVRLNSSGDVNGSNKVLQDAVYSFNPNNNITNVVNTTTDFNTQYVYDYDGLGRLTSANGSYIEPFNSNFTQRFQQSFVYAKNGNLSSKRFHDPLSGNISDVWSYQYTNHQVTNIDSSKSGNDTLVMQYDANGNLTRQRDNVKDLTKRISIDSQDRITQIQDGNNAVLGSYWYDESGFRIRKSSLEPKNNVFSNVEILYPSKFFGLEFIESENVISSVNNVYLNGVRIAALNEAGALAYYLTDQVDSVSTVLDDEGNTLSFLSNLLLPQPKKHLYGSKLFISSMGVFWIVLLSLHLDSVRIDLFCGSFRFVFLSVGFTFLTNNLDQNLVIDSGLKDCSYQNWESCFLSWISVCILLSIKFQSPLDISYSEFNAFSSESGCPISLPCSLK